MKVKVCLTNGDTDFSDIVAGGFAPYLFIICLDYVLDLIYLIKENGFTLKMARSRLYPTETITDADNLALLANEPFLLHCLEQTAAGIGLPVNRNKTRCFKCGAISTLSGKPLKLVDKLIYHISNISSTESDVNIT